MPLFPREHNREQKFDRIEVRLVPHSAGEVTIAVILHCKTK